MSSKFRLKPHNLLDLVSFTHAEKTSPAGDQHTVCFDLDIGIPIRRLL